MSDHNINMFEISVMNETERKYKRFCDKNGVPVVFLHQNPDSFSKVLNDNDAKRPDFQHFTEIGEFFVDVKSSKLEAYPKFTLSITDYLKLNKTQIILKKPILIAYPIDPWKGEDWGYISLSKIREIKEKQQHFIKKGYRWIGIEYNNLRKYHEIIQLLIRKRDINEN